jgi:hypothetical protein
LIYASAFEDPFDPVQRTTANADAPAGTDVGVWKAGDILVDRCAEAFDLFPGDWSALSCVPHETQNALRSQDLQALLDSLSHADECITTEHGHFHLALPVTPPMDLVKHRKKRANMLFFKLRGHPLFVPRFGMDRVPVRPLRREIQRQYLRFNFEMCLWTIHSFALSVPFLNPNECSNPCPTATYMKQEQVRRIGNP